MQSLVARRRAISVLSGAAITLFWGAMMFSLVREKILPQRRETILAQQALNADNLVRDWRDVEEFAVLKYRNKAIGATESTIRREGGESGPFLADFRFAMQPTLLGLPRNVSIYALARLDPLFQLERFYIQADLSAVLLQINGMVTGDSLLIEINRGGDKRLAAYHLDRAISLLEAVNSVATRSFEIRPGNSISVPVVDPIWSLQRGVLQVVVRGKEKIVVGGAEVEAFRVESRLNDFVSRSWVDSSGATLRRQLVGDLFLERADRKAALKVSETLQESIAFPRFDTAQFAGLKPQPLSDIAQRQTSPLSVLGQLTP